MLCAPAFAEAVQGLSKLGHVVCRPEIATLDEQRERITKDPWKGMCCGLQTL